MATALYPPESPDVLYIVDLSGYVFRAYHAIAPLNSPSGEPTQAVFGTVNMLERLVRERRPLLLAVAMDSRKPTFRKERYPAYKANRPPPPPDLQQQMKRVKEIVDAFPICCFQSDGFEADDLIATAVRQCRNTQLKTVIVSADKDLMQLVGPDVVLWDTMRDRVHGVEEVEERFGVRVAQVRDVLALMGDSSDNIPGVPSIGPKTARDLITEYHTIEGVYQHLSELKRKKLRETLEANHEQALLSQELVTLKDDVPVSFDVDALRFGKRNLPQLRKLYAELGFQRHLAAIDREAEASGIDASKGTETTEEALAATHTATYELITTDAQLTALQEDVRNKKTVALVPILQGPSRMSSAMIGLGIAASPECAYYLPIAHRYVGAPAQLSERTVLDALQHMLPPAELVGHDVSSLFIALEQLGLTDLAASFDALIGHYLLDPGSDHSLERLVLEELGRQLLPIDDLVRVPGKRARVPIDEVDVERAMGYAAPRAAALLELRPRMENRLEEENLHQLWRELELPLLLLLVELERQGILVDTKLLARLSQRVGKDLEALEHRAHEVAGKEFNVNSPRQLETLLFDELGLKPIRRTKTSRSTDAETLEALREEHDLPKVILEIRQLSKLKGTYLDALPELVNKQTGRLHTRWHQDVAATGRLSSSDPNLQNIPIRSELGRRIREAFIAPPGCVLISADYSQIELRVLAHLSQDPVLLDAFRREQDIHLRTAMEIFEVPEQEVTSELRRRAKAVNFGVIYGQGDSALGKSLGISRAEAGQFIAAYFRRYAGVREFMDNTLQTTRASGSVHTLFGRRRLVPDINNPNRAKRLAAERIAMNTPIQGTAADLLKKAMIALKDPVTPATRMLLTVHDELVFETKAEQAEQAMQRIRQAMQEVHPLDVPLLVDIGSGPNWGAAH